MLNKKNLIYMNINIKTMFSVECEIQICTETITYCILI